MSLIDDFAEKFNNLADPRKRAALLANYRRFNKADIQMVRNKVAATKPSTSKISTKISANLGSTITPKSSPTVAATDSIPADGATFTAFLDDYLDVTTKP